MQVVVAEGATSSPITVTSSLGVQNLGPGVLYVGAGTAPTEDSGIRLDPGDGVTMNTAGGGVILLASDADCDVRTQIGVTSFFRS